MPTLVPSCLHMTASAGAIHRLVVCKDRSYGSGSSVTPTLNVVHSGTVYRTSNHHTQHERQTVRDPFAAATVGSPADFVRESVHSTPSPAAKVLGHLRAATS